MRYASLIVVAGCLALAAPLSAQETDCQEGEVTFETAGVVQVLSLRIHERGAEVGAGLFRITELPPLGGVFAVYPEPRDNRNLSNSDVLAADMMSFDSNGKVLALMPDVTGLDVDTMRSGTGMLYAAYLAEGTIAAAAFDKSTVMTGWTCTDGG